MIEVFPNYYKNFKCIADKCKHNCCIGWEIDIDEDTMEVYHSMNSEFGEKICKNIDGEIPHFVLTKDNKCPFLKDNGLCEIICKCGEDAISEICTLHPRFRNFYSAFTETGLGLCCEEVARIILTENEKFLIDFPENIELFAGEREFFEKRKEIFSILQDRKSNIKQRFCKLANIYDLKLDFSLKDILDNYLSLERLDEEWTRVLNLINEYEFDMDIFENNEYQIFFEQFSVYLIFRHLHNAVWDDNYKSYIVFALISCYLVGAVISKAISKDKNFGINDATEIVRMYSSEIEYCENNVALLLNMSISN